MTTAGSKLGGNVRASPNGSPLIYDKFVIDPQERQVLVGGAPVKIGARAFHLLMVLAERNGRVASKDELLEQVWPKMVVEENTLQVHISTLRKLLGHEVIVTVPGLGYRFTAREKEKPPPGAPQAAQAKQGAPEEEQWFSSAPSATTDFTSAGAMNSAPGKAPGAVPDKRGIATRRAVKRVTLGLLICAFAGAAWFLGVHVGERPESPAAQNAIDARPPLEPPLAAAPETSIAVLPFVDMSEKKDQEYFADGLAEELLDLLSRVPDLQVVARTSAFAFKGKSDDLATIAAKLHVANVLEGSVRKSGSNLRISVQLIRAKSGYHLWSQTYDRQLDDVFKIQNDIATSVVGALKDSLLKDAMPKATGTRNMEAHELYLQARSMRLHAATAAEWERVAQFLERAVELDPNFAAAWTTLSGIRAGLAAEAQIPSQKEWSKAFDAAKRALELDPNLPDAHSAMAKVFIQRDWNLNAGQGQVRQALALDPNNAWALAWAGDLALIRGQLEPAVDLLRKGVAADPVNSYRYDELSTALLAAGRFDEASAAARRSLEMNDRRPGAHVAVGLVDLVRGDAPAALSEFDRETSEDFRLFGQALAHHALRQKSGSDSALTALSSKYSGQATIHIAEVHAFRGEADQAFAWLERAYRQHNERCLYAVTDPLLRNLQADPRFKAFVRKVGIPE
jgi:TolB-like protein/DNA-binding winged helix-turn-helix (wHTH) protein/tetratricopeptide (TPR) repeat protein